MDTPYLVNASNVNALSQIIIDTSYQDKIKKNSRFSLETFHFWDEDMNKFFSERCVDNLTDFNDSKCFTYFIAIDGQQFHIGTDELSAYLKEGNQLYFMQLLISAEFPVISFQYIKYDKSPTNFFIQPIPFKENHKNFKSIIAEFSKKNNLAIIDSSILELVTRETSPKTISAYFFEL